MSDRVSLRVGGRNYYGWTGVQITSSIEQAVTSFAVSAVQRFGDGDPVRIHAGDRCEVFIGADKVCTGHIDKPSPSIDGTSHTIAFAGRSLTADLVDCSAIHKPGRWRGRRYEQIAKDLLAPFGIGLVVQVPTGAPITRHAIEGGETVFDSLDRLARPRSLLLTDDAEGRLVITRIGTAKADSAVEYGINMLRGSATADASQVYSTYIARGQRVGSDDDFGAAVVDASGTAVDAGVGRYRPLLVSVEGQTTKASAKARAVWEAATRLGKSLGASVTVTGWRQESGRLWQPGELVTLRAEPLGISGELLIVGVTRSLNEGGMVTELDLGLPDAYRAEPPKAKSRSGVGGGLWKELRAPIKPGSAGGSAWQEANKTFDILTGRGSP